MKRTLSALLMLLTLTFALSAVPAVAATETITSTQLMDTVAASQGKVVLVNFFAAFCPPCRKEIPGLIEIRKDFTDKDLLIIGIGVDETKAEMDAFVSKIGINYPHYYGGDEVAYFFRIEAIPFNIIYDRTGKMVFSQEGYIQEKELRSMLKNIMDK